MTSETTKSELFTGLPRRRRLGGLVTAALLLVLCGAFVTDAVPTRSSEDWLYDLEARRDQLARAHQAREAAARPERRAARTPPAQRARPAALAAAAAPAVDHEPEARPHQRCVRPAE